MAFEREWHVLQDGDFLKAAEMAGFDASVTTDQNFVTSSSNESQAALSGPHDDRLASD